jgi:uncharacterized membrane protein
MKEWLIAITEPTIVVIDAIALAVIVFGTLEALFHVVRFGAKADPRRARQVWVRYGHWLVAALTFQLGADIIESSISTDWESIARLGAIAVIRTFLNYFLERDLGEREDGVKAKE